MKLFRRERQGRRGIIHLLGMRFSYARKGGEDRIYPPASVFNYLLDRDSDVEAKKWFLQRLFKWEVGYVPDIDNPRSLNEKIQWLKLYYQDPGMTRCADKYAVKEYVREVAGEGHTVPVLAAWNRAEDVDIRGLPARFVLKVNWSSGFNIIVGDKSKLDATSAKARLREWMQPWSNSYYRCFNWAYKHMKPVIYAEEYIEQAGGGIDDHKVFCFNGKPRLVLVISERFSAKRIVKTFLDLDWNVLPIWRTKARKGRTIPRPAALDAMLALSEKLARPFPLVRVDFYVPGGQPKIGEMTFYPGGGLEPFHPRQWDYTIGDMLTLPERR